MNAYHLTSEHETFRNSLRQFIQKEILPVVDTWEEKGEINKEIWVKMGQMGYFGLIAPEKYGGMNLDFYYSMIFCEELSHCFSGGFTISALVTQFMSAPYLTKHASEYLKEHYLTKLIQGELVGAIAITEPGCGSDIKALRTTAVLDGEHYIVNGSKTFITNGYYGDFFITAVKTDTKASKNNISLLIIDKNTPGLSTSKLKKLGWHASDTAELNFDNVKVPCSHLVGEEGKGFSYLMSGLQLERLTAAIHSLATAESALKYTKNYLKERQAFGKKLKDISVLRHKTAQMIANISTTKAFVYHCCDLQQNGVYAVKECSIAKLQASELAIDVVNSCLQLFGGYGYIEDYKIARLYRDVRVGTIIAGTSEIMLEIVAKIELDEVDYTQKIN